MSICSICPLKEKDRSCEFCQLGNSEVPANLLEFVKEAAGDAQLFPAWHELAPETSR